MDKPTTGHSTGQRKKYEEISEHLELLIFSGKLSEGDRIPSERELMARFGAGRSSVREALFSLQRKGLLSARPGATARVVNPTADAMMNELSGAVRHFLSRPEGVRELQNARILFEVGLARYAALHANEDDIARLEAALERNRQAKDQETFAKTDLDFHYALAVIAQNQIFSSLNLALTQWLAEQRSVTAKAGATWDEVYVQHKAIFDAIAARDPVAAEDAMDKHLQFVADLYWKARA